LKAQVPVRTFGEWEAVPPGAVQADLVAHCGASTDGFYLTTLVAVDVATGWTECQAVWGKGQQRVGSALHHIRRRLPVRLRELHTDNGGEFLNEVIYPYCRREGIRLTRGRPYKKNDQAYVEQKNGSVVRRLIGYERYATKAAYEQLGRIYDLLRVYLNFFQPVRKLISKERVGARVRKRFDAAQTPYQRLLTAGMLDEQQRQVLDELYRSLNPVRVRAEIDQALDTLWQLSEQPSRARRQPVLDEPAADCAE
jgi:transposase InsO family protein